MSNVRFDKRKQKISDNNATTEEARRLIHRAVVKLLNQRPFFGHVLANMRKEIVPDLKMHDGETRGTMCVRWIGKQVALASQPDFVIENQEFLVGLLEHEVRHIVFDHLRRISMEALFTDPELANIAGDIVCNQTIEHKMPKDVALPETFKFEKNLTMNEYYKLLQKASHNMTITLVSGDGEGEDEGEDGEGQGGEGQGQDEKDGQGGEGDDPKDGEGKGGKKEIKIRAIDQHTKDHIKNPQLRSQLKDLVRRAKDSTPKGKMPGDLAGAIEDLIGSKPAQLSWRQLLQRFMTAAIGDEIEYTIHRRSKRYGTFPGLKHESLGVYALVAFDNSGSVSDEELEQFFGELKGILKRIPSSRVDFVQHDTRIQSIEDNYSNFSGKDVVRGRGGTDLRPVYDLAKDRMRHGYEYSCIIHMTDGYGPAPKLPPRVPVLWVFTENHAKPGENFPTWGATVELKAS